MISTKYIEKQLKSTLLDPVSDLYCSDYYENNVKQLEYEEEYQRRILECMIGQVTDNYITTPETDSSYVKLEYSKEGLVTVANMKGKTILVDSEGNETSTPGPDCRLVSVGEDRDDKVIISSVNKNLFDGELEVGSIGDKDGISNTYQNAIRTKNYIRVGSDTVNYSFSQLTSSASPIDKIYCYDKNLNYLGYLGFYSHSGYIRLLQGTKYIRVRWYGIENASVDKIKNFQVEQGSNPTNYVKSQKHSSEILLPRPLKSLPNGVCDEISRNILTINTQETTLTGDEKWYINNPWETDTILPVYMNSLPNRLSHSYVSCNRFDSLRYSETTEGGSIVKECLRYDSGAVYFFINKDRLSTPDLDGWKDWLKRNPIQVIYTLDTPMVIELPNTVTLQGYDDTTICIENDIVPHAQYKYNASIPYKEEIVSQSKEVLVNSLDIEYNILPYLMEIEFQLMNMEV